MSLFGLHFPAGSVWGYLLSVATVVQVLVLPIAGAVADRSHNKRRILGGFAFLGAAAAAAMFFLAGSDWQLGVVLFVVANIGYGGSLVVYYSFLVDIGGPDERDDISAKGWAFGYLGGGLALALQLGFYLGHDAFGGQQGHGGADLLPDLGAVVGGCSRSRRCGRSPGGTRRWTWCRGGRCCGRGSRSCGRRSWRRRRSR